MPASNFLSMNKQKLQISIRDLLKKRKFISHQWLILHLLLILKNHREEPTNIFHKNKFKEEAIRESQSMWGEL
jgi:hypothetical protein